MAKIDLLRMALDEGAQPMDVVSRVGDGNEIYLGDVKEYDTYLSENNKDNPNAINAEYLNALYEQTKELQRIYNDGYFVPQREDLISPVMSNALKNTNNLSFMQQSKVSNIPYISSALSPHGLQNVSNQKKDAFNDPQYAVFEKGKYTYLDKPEDWEKLPGKFVYTPDPRTGGMTQMLELVPDGVGTAGRDELSIWGPPETYVKNWVGATAANAGAFIFRVPKYAINTVQGIDDYFSINIGGQSRDIFDDQTALDKYANEMFNLLQEESDKKLLSDTLTQQAVGKKEQNEVLKVFNYLENKLPVTERHRMMSMRLPKDYMRRQEKYNKSIGKLASLENVQFDEMAYLLEHGNIGAFIYQTAAVLADMIPQIAMSFATGGLGALAAGAGIAKAMTGRAIGGFIGSMVVGGGHAVGSTIEALQDAGFSKEEIGSWMPLIATALPLTEGLVGGSWMGRYGTKSALSTFKRAMVNDAKELFAKTGGKLSFSDATEITRKSVMRFWENPKIKDFLQKSYFTRELPAATIIEAAQEISEDLIYNSASLGLNKNRPDYYKGFIDSGINEWFGEEGVFNGKEMLQTALITIFATGILDTSMAAMQGKFKKGYSSRIQEIGKSAWAQEQAAKGKLGMFRDMAREEMSTSDHNTIFGSRKNLLADIGAENIVIPAEQAGQFAGMNIGKLQDDGSILIDNLADARYMEFLQTISLYENIANEYRLNGTTVNSQMLHELTDAGQNLLSSNALSIAIELNNASEELANFEKENNDVEALQGEKKKTYQELLSNKEELQRKLSYYTTLEEGTQYSKAVNDNVKTFLFTYDQAEEKTKEQMKLQELDLKNKKVYNTMRKNWNLKLLTEYNYEQIADVYKAMLNDKNRVLEERAKLLTQLKNIKPENFDSVSQQTDAFVEQLTKTLELKDNKKFVSGMNEVTALFDNLQKNIYSEINNRFMPPAIVAEMTGKYTKIYEEALERLGGIGSTEVSLEDNLLNAGLDEMNAMLIAQSIEGGADLESIGISDEMKEIAAPIVEEAIAPEMARKVAVPKKYDFSEMMNKYDSELQERISELSKPFTITDAFNRWIEEVEHKFEKAINAMDKDADPIPNNEYYGMSQERITADIQYFWSIAEALKKSDDMAKRLEGKKLFEQHSTKDEQELLGIMNDAEKRKVIDDKYNSLNVKKREFEQKAGMLLMSSLAKQKHTGSIMLQTQIRHLLTIIDKLNLKESIDKDIYEDLVALNIDEIIEVEENGEIEKKSIYSMRGNYNSAVEAKLLKANVARINVIDHLQNQNILQDKKNKQILLEPFTLFRDTINPRGTKGTTSFLSSVSFDGSFERPQWDENGKMVSSLLIYDAAELRYDASRIDLYSVNPLVGTELKSARKVHVEALQQYSSLLAILNINTNDENIKKYSLRKIYNARKKIYGNVNNNPSTYEQTMVEDNVIALLLMNTITEDINALFKDTATITNINNAFIIPGDYGTGKTQHVFRRVLQIMNMIQGNIKDHLDLDIYTPSEKLSETHKSTFKGLVRNITAKSFNDFDTMEGAKKGAVKFIIIDEGSLLSGLNNNEIEKIQKRAAIGEGKTKIIILADINQMRQKEDMKTNDRYPPIMRYAFKTATLTEQFSTDSPIIQQHAAYWKARASIKTSVDTNIPMGYYETHNGHNYGVRFNKTETEIAQNFLGATNLNKALIFEDYYHYQEFINSASAEMRNSLTDPKNNDKIYFLYYEGKPTDRVIQGLREEEVYLMRNPYQMYFGKTKGEQQYNDFVGVYTAVGRASKFINMNIGAIATEKMATEPSKAFSIGRIDDNSKLNKDKVDAMRLEAERLFTELATEDEVEKGAKNVGEEAASLIEEGEEKGSGIVPLEYEEGNEIKIAYKSWASEEEGRDVYAFSIPNYGTYEITLPKDAEKVDIAIAAEKVYESVLAEAKSKGKTNNKGGKINKLSYTIKNADTTYTIKVGDSTNKGDIFEIYTQDNILNVAVIRPDGTKEILNGAGLVGLTVLDTNEDIDIKKAFTSQAFMFDKFNAIYGTPYMSFGEPTEEYEAIRALRAYIVHNAAELNIKMKMVAYPQQSTYFGQTNTLEEGFRLVIDLDGDVEKILLSLNPNAIKDGAVKELIKSINKDNVKNYVEDLRHMAMVAVPLASPMYKAKNGRIVKEKPYYFTLEGDHSKLIPLIIDNYNKVIDAVTDEKIKMQLFQQMGAQIAIAEMYIAHINDIKKSNSKSAKPIDGAVREKTYVKVEYDNKIQKPLPVFLDTLKKSGRFFFDEDSMANLNYDKRGRLRFYFTMQPIEGIKPHSFIVNIKTLKLSGAAAVQKMMEEDKKTLAAITTSSDVFDSRNDKISAAFDAFEKAIRLTHAYRILAANRANLTSANNKNQKANKLYSKYFQFGYKGGFININGETTNEKKENLSTLIDLIYTQWQDELYNYVTRNVVEENGVKKLKGFPESELDKMYVQIRNINDEHFFFSLDNGITKSVGNANAQTSSNEEISPDTNTKKKKKKPSLQEAATDTFDNEYTLEQQAKEAMKPIFGENFTKQKMIFVNGFINHNGKIATGMAENGYMYLAKTARGIRFSTPYHEAMHIIWEDLIDPVARKKYEHLARKIALKETGKTLYGTELKEWMASDFAKRVAYRQNKLTHDDISESWRVNAKEMSLWQKFKAVMNDILNFFVKFRNRMDIFYDEILNGKYKEQNLSGNTYKYFEEETSDNFSIPEEEAYENDERTDKIRQYINLQKNIQTIFPDATQTLTRMENNIRYNMLKTCYLGNQYLPNIPNMHDMHQGLMDEIDSWEDYNEEVGNMQVLANGNLTLVKDLRPEDYNNIEALTGETLTERVNLAKSYMRTFYMSKRENVITVIQHMVPHFNPDDDYIKRTKNTNTQFEKDNYDPYTDGFTTELKLHMASIPKIRLLNGRLEINEETGGFIDQRAAENAYLYLGDKAREIYKLDYAKDPDQANMTTAFEKALANEINGLYDGQTNDDGTFKSVNLEVYVSLAMKFFGINVYALFDGNRYYNEDNTEFYPLKNIAGIIINKYKGKKIDTEIALAEMQRARHIAQFLSMFSTNAASKKLTNNSKEVISKVKENVFTDTYIQYSKNIYDFINNNMKNALNGKFQFGMLYNKKAIKDIKRYIDIDEDNSISIADEKFVTVRRDDKGLKRYIYTSNLNTNTFISLYDIIKKSIGLPKNALSNRMLRRLFREDDNMPAAIRESIMNQAIKNTNFKLHDALNSMGARSMFEQYVANIIYANMAQITSFDLDITYSVNGQTEKYNRNADIREHVSALGDILQKNNDSTVTIKYKNDSGKFVSVNGTGMSLLGKLFNEKFLVSKLPMLSPVYDYISMLGLQNVLKTGNADEYFTSIGIPLPTPAQFYPITEALAAYVASQTGNNKWQTVRTPNKKTKPVVQGSSIMNDIADGSASRMNMISAFYEQHKEAKLLSPYFDKKGNSLIPYMSGNATGGTLSLDHVDSFMGLERNYGGQYTMGKNELNTHDFFLSAYNIFMSKVKKSTTYTQVIATPVMTISSTGKTYILNHIFRNEKGHIVNVTRTDNRTRVELNYELAKAQIVNQVKIIEREIELARQRFNDFINDVNAIIPEKNLHISLGVTEKTNKRDISRGEFIQNNAELIEKQLDKLPLELRMEIIEMARKSNLAKGKDIIIDDANLSFSMGEVVMDDIKDLTHGNNIYNKTNREALLKASDKEAEKVLKSIFRDDFISFVDYMTEIGLDAESSFVRNMIDDAFYDKENKIFEFYKKDASEVKSLNNSLFAFYMMFHISNNSFDILNGNPLSYKGVMDQVKRMGPQNTPIIHLDTNMQLDGNYIGSLPASGPAISIKNLMTEPQIKDDMKAIVDALDGSSIVSPLHRRMFDVSSGGSSYSIVGNTCMIKTLGLFKDPISGKVNQIKHAAKFITENDFNNSLAYKRMVIDLFKAQDKWLAENEHYKEVVKGTEFEGYSWYEHFAEYYNKTQSMDKAVDLLFDDLVQSQYYESYDINDEGNYIDYNGNLYTKDEIETKHKTLYTLLAKSVVYGYNPESVTKTTATAINNYNPEDSQRDTEFSFSTIDYTGMGIVNTSDQPMNDSKKQSPYSQIMGLLGYGDYKLSGANGNPGNKNPGIAIMQKQNELYYEGMRLINAEINAIVPHNVEWKEGMPKFADVDWVNVDSDTRDLSYALAQLEGFMRDIAKAGMADAAIQGNYVEMLSDVGISRQFPQIRNKLIQTYRNYINTNALKRGMNGMRATQASGVFHKLYYLKGDENGMPYTRQEALEHINIYKETIEDIDAIEERLAEKFDIKGLNDMRVENGETKRGQVIMPYAYARTLGLRMKGEEGATKDETLRDLFSLSMQEGKIDIRTMGLTELLYHLGSNEFTDDVAESPLVRAALRNLRRVKNNRQHAHLRTDEFVELEGMLENLAEEIITLRDSAIDTLKVFAVRTPSNGLGNGAWYDIAGFHGDGNVIYIPVGMTLLNNSDFDIDQLAVYFKKLDKKGHKLDDTTNRLFNDVLDITEEVYMAKANQPDIFIESSIKEIKKIANEVSKEAAPTPYNSAYSLLKSYEENRVGDRAIGILVNTLSAAVYLSTLNEINKKIVPGTEADNPMSAIVSKARKSMRGKESLIIMVGDWLQAALDNPKENALGKYGVTEESIPILGLMIAKGPRIDPKTKKVETTDEFFRRVKAFFNDYTVHNKFAEEALSNSLYMDRRGKDLYSSIQKHLYYTREKIKAHPLRNMSQVDKIASPKEVKDFVKANMLADINAYRALMNFEGSIEMSNDMTEAEEERYNTALGDYIRSIDLKKKNPSEEEQRQIKTYLEYRNLTTRVAGAQQRKGLQKALEALEELDEYIAQAIALRNVSRLVSLRQGLPGKDSDRAFLIKEIELIFGTDLRSILAGNNVTEEQFIDYFKKNSNQYVLAPNTESQRMLLDKAVRAFRMINLSEYLKTNPMTRVHLAELLREQNIASKMFSVDSPFYKSIEKSYIAKIGLNAWRQKTQWSTFMEAFSELALDRYFERYWNKTISIALPSNLGGKYIEGDGILSQLNLSNIHHREMFSLMFPEIIELLQTSYISAEDMEAAFMAISPEFAGISESFFDKDGRRINNAFADVLTKVGSNERYYAGFELSTSEISDEARVSIQEGFSMLPEALKQLFLANEIIANKMYYKKGSISDAIGVDIFRGGLSEIYNEFYDDVSAGNVFENAEMEERFYDYVSTLSGMTPYVEESKIGLENNTEYFHTYKRAGDGSYTVHYKQRAEDADAKPIYKLTPRAGITMDPRYSIISNIPYLTLTGEELVELEDGDKPITKFYIKGHGYKRGYYITEMGTAVHVNPEGNIVTITKKEIPENYTRQETRMQEYDDYVFDERYANKESNYYEGNIKPEPNTIFVFGSNPEGRHGAGAAKVAREQFGAVYGQGEGLQGNAYALPTKDLRVKENRGFKSISPEQITNSIKKLYEVAKQNPDKQFKVAYRNTTDTSLNGYTGLEMIEMFNQAGTIPSNVIFSKEWVDTGKLNTQSEITPLVRNIESYMEERINLINEIMNSNKSELPVEVLSEMSMDQLRNILKC